MYPDLLTLERLSDRQGQHRYPDPEAFHGGEAEGQGPQSQGHHQGWPWPRSRRPRDAPEPARGRCKPGLPCRRGGKPPRRGSSARAVPRLGRGLCPGGRPDLPGYPHRARHTLDKAPNVSGTRREPAAETKRLSGPDTGSCQSLTLGPAGASPGPVPRRAPDPSPRPAQQAQDVPRRAPALYPGPGPVRPFNERPPAVLAKRLSS